MLGRAFVGSCLQESHVHILFDSLYQEPAFIRQ